ncbi:TadE/TadG family type IV pilus assembly protein [Streptomyces sp. NPDC088725]|uniref:TadE/TadG family type IV pilus assembly protein n=1 Tax=Streptomyces sp. NPDC088725 TaxID=3365873 RepID=UPI0038013061
MRQPSGVRGRDGSRDRHRHGAGPAAESRDQGQAALEYVGVITLLLLVALAAIQLGIAAYTVQQAGTAARAAARTASYPDRDYAAAGHAALSGWLSKGASFGMGGAGGNGVTVTATVRVPAILPVFHFGSATRSVTMPLDRP